MLTVVSSALFCSCGFDFSGLISNTSSMDNSKATSSSVVSKVKTDNKISTSYCYDNLSSEKLKDMYMAIGNYAESASEEYFTVDYAFSDVQLSEAFDAYISDHPEVFWLKSSFEYVQYKNRTSVKLSFNITLDELDSAKKKFNSAINDALDGAPSGVSDYELELYANDYLVKNCSYDEEAAKTSEIISHENDAYGALVDKKAVCEGYSRAFQLLCNKLGVDCVSISGEGNNTPHQWNSVLLDGEWYEVDVTWNDFEKEIKVPTYDYFNLTSKKFYETHTPESVYKDITESEFKKEGRNYNVFVPECNGEKYNYYSYSCVTLNDLNDSDEITNGIAKAAKEGKEYYYFLIGDNLDYQSTSDSLVNDGYIYEWIGNANAANWYNPNLNQQCKAYCDKESNTIIIELEYNT